MRWTFSKSSRLSYERPGVAEILTERSMDMKEIIQHTDYEGLDIVTAKMNLLSAGLAVMLEQKRSQQTRFQKTLQQVSGQYDFCIIGNAPDINISTINVLVASDDMLVPVTIDDFVIDGLAELKEQMDNTREDFGLGKDEGGGGGRRAGQGDQGGLPSAREAKLCGRGYTLAESAKRWIVALWT